MLHLATLLLAQSQTPPTLLTGTPLDTLVNAIYAILGLGSLQFIDKVAFWAMKFKGRSSGGDGLSRRLESIEDTQREHVHATNDVSKTIDRFESDTRSELRSIRDRLADVQARMDAR